MPIKVSGKNIDIGDSLREYVVQEVSNLIDKYAGEKTGASVTFTKDHRLFDVDACVHLSKGFILKTSGSSDDPYKAVASALERLEDRIKKHKHRIMDKTRRVQWEEGAKNATGYVLERTVSANVEADEEHLVIAEQERFVLTLSVSEAVMKLDLGDLPVVMFRNAESDRINVVYKRHDAHIGWIDYKE